MDDGLTKEGMDGGMNGGMHDGRRRDNKMDVCTDGVVCLSEVYLVCLWWCI